MTTTGDGTRAWGGDPQRKQLALQAVAKTIATDPRVWLRPIFVMATPDIPFERSNVYCAAFGTTDPAELELQSGVTLDVLRLIGAVHFACVIVRPPPGPEDPLILDVPPAAVGGELRALEAIPVGADLGSIPERYLLALHDELQSGVLIDGRTLGAATQQALAQVAVLHRSGSDDAAAFRAVRRAAMQANDSATSDLDKTVLGFVEAVAWPAGSLGGELASHVEELHGKLASELGSQQPTPEERRIRAVAAAAMMSLIAQRNEDLSLDADWFRQRAQQVPEVVTSSSNEFQARMAQYFRVACYEHAPRAVAGLMRVLAAT